MYCGIDWAEKTHDVALVDDCGQLPAKRHITDDAVGYKVLLDLLAEYGDSEESPIPVAIETSRGLLVAVLRTGNRKVFAINPMAAARYRDLMWNLFCQVHCVLPWFTSTIGRRVAV
ncbi:IS110 family transposase, partial [Streptomyces sp. CoH27]|uniref:IS110 family transposase n=1 Tax=Streptomyces sp. CoH27 TaxID=2875763 RepID=UPI001CD7BCAC